MNFDRTFPPLLKELHELKFDYHDGNGIDFKPYSEFLSADENTSWFRAWTGNQTLDGGSFRIFGQDGTGGYAAFWLTQIDRPILEQPIVFFGSEGELGVIAKNFADYLWLLAGGFGPFEAISCADSNRSPNPAFAQFAAHHALGEKKAPFEILRAARLAFPKFEGEIRVLCR